MAQAVDRLELTRSRGQRHRQSLIGAQPRRNRVYLALALRHAGTIGQVPVLRRPRPVSLITAYRGDTARTLLFDTGPEEWVFERNVTRLGVDLGRIEAMVLSHGHWDHAGAMPRALQMIAQRNGGRDVPTYMHPGMFRTRAMIAPDGSMRVMEDVPSVELLAQNGASLVLTTEPKSVLDDMFFVSGEIPRVTPFEQGMPGQH